MYTVTELREYFTGNIFYIFYFIEISWLLFTSYYTVTQKSEILVMHILPKEYIINKTHNFIGFQSGGNHEYIKYTYWCCFTLSYFFSTYPCPFILRLKHPSLSQPKESAPHCDKQNKNIKSTCLILQISLHYVLNISWTFTVNKV